MSIALPILVAIVVWFVGAAILFFNPIVDKVYRNEEEHPAVRSLPQEPATIGKIVLAITVQVVTWFLVFTWIRDALPTDSAQATLIFGTILNLTKIVPRDVDRVLLTTYPPKRMTIEFAIGLLMSYLVAGSFVYVA